MTKIQDLQPSNTNFSISMDILQEIGRENLLVTESQTWHWDDKGYWKKISDRHLKQIIQNQMKFKGIGVAVRKVNEIAEMIKTEVFASDHEWNKDIDAINFRNGELHLIKGEWNLKPHNRASYRTTVIPHNYEESDPCPRFEKFLDEVFEPDSDAGDKKKLIKETIGYTLTNHTKFEKFILLVGPGANGKSVLLDLAREIVGPDNAAAVQPSEFTNKFQRAFLQDKLANLVTEIAEGKVIADAETKAIVSGEITTVEHKNGHPFNIKPFSTCWFGANHLPHTRDFSNALFRRAFVVEFNRVFFEGKDADPDLKQKLIVEIPGIIFTCLNAYKEVVKRGKFTEPSSCLTAKERWRKEADQAQQFADECLLVSADHKIPTKEVYMEYQAWAQSNGITKKLNHNNLSNRLEKAGFPLTRGAQGVRMIHAKLLPQNSIQDADSASLASPMSVDDFF